MVDSIYRIVRHVIKKRYNEGEDLELLLNHYNELTEEEKDEIRNDFLNEEENIDSEKIEY